MAQVLIVDKNADYRDLHERYLKKYGHQVRSAQSDYDAQTQLRVNAAIEAIIYDISLPENSHSEFLIWKDASPEFALIPVLLVSSDDTAPEEFRGYELFRKPVHFDELAFRIGQLSATLSCQSPCAS